jgi:hypothetical protein
MGRERQFRGKRKDNGEWIYGFYAYKHDGDRHFIMRETIADVGPSYFTDYEVFAESVGQNTGLKNNNDVEIYAGDILLWEQAGLSVKVKVQYKHGMFLAGDMPLYDCLDEEVIGDVYTNPELLEV